MKNEIIREYENDNLIIYKRISRQERGVQLYFVDNKNEKGKGYAGMEMRDIRGVRAFIKSLNNL